MYLTEKEAKNKTCAITIGRANNSHCMASECMTGWRTLVGVWNIKEERFLTASERYSDVDDNFEERNNPDKGYCGLGGKP